MVELYSDEDTNYYYLSSDDEPEPNTSDLFALLPTDLNTLIYSFLTMKEIIKLSQIRRSLTYLSKDDASIWKTPLPSGIEDVYTVYIHGHSKVRLSLYNIGLVEGDRAKWVMYNYIKEKKSLNDKKYDMKIFNSILVDLRMRINRIRQNTTRIDLKREYAKGCERKKIVEAEIEAESNRIVKNYNSFHNISKRLLNESNDVWVNVKIRITLYTEVATKAGKFCKVRTRGFEQCGHGQK